MKKLIYFSLFILIAGPAARAQDCQDYVDAGKEIRWQADRIGPLRVQLVAAQNILNDKKQTLDALTAHFKSEQNSESSSTAIVEAISTLNKDAQIYLSALAKNSAYRADIASLKNQILSDLVKIQTEDGRIAQGYTDLMYKALALDDGPQVEQLVTLINSTIINIGKAAQLEQDESRLSEESLKAQILAAQAAVNQQQKIVDDLNHGLALRVSKYNASLSIEQSLHQMCTARPQSTRRPFY